MMLQCPECLSFRTRLEPHRWYEAPLLLFFVQPHRCRHCDRRFLRFRRPDLPTTPRSGRTLAAR